MGRILILAHEHFVFQLPHPLDLAELCARDGHEVIVAAAFTDESRRWNVGRGFEIVQLADGRPMTNASFVWHALNVARRVRPDVVVGVNVLGFVATDLARRARYTRHTAYYPMELSLPDEWPRSVSVRWQIEYARHTDLVFTTGRERAEEMQRRFELPSTPLAVANSPLRGPSGASGELRARLRKAGFRHERVILYTGSAGENNGLLTAVAASKLWKSDVGLAVQAFGGAPAFRTELERAVADSDGRSILLPSLPGTRDDLLRYIAAADAGLVMFDHRADRSLNMLWYTPTKLFDYMSCGLPVIASDNPTLLQDVEALGWGACCDPRDPVAIAAAVDRVFVDPKAMGRKATELFHGPFDFAKQSEEVRRRLTLLANGP